MSITPSPKQENYFVAQKIIANENFDFRHVLYTSDRHQFVVMCLEPRQDIGSEIHDTIDQTFFITFGHGIAELGQDRKQYKISKGSIIHVPAGTRHNIKNPSHSKNLHFFTLYSPPAHKPGTIHKTKSEAEKEEY